MNDVFVGVRVKIPMEVWSEVSDNLYFRVGQELYTCTVSDLTWEDEGFDQYGEQDGSWYLDFTKLRKVSV